MLAQISWVLFCILVLISALHLYWAIGGFWPGGDEKSLARTVIGTTSITHMPPPLLTGIVALCIFGAAILPLMWSAQIPYSIPQGLVWMGMWGLSVIFVGRGIAGYTAYFRRMNGDQPFARLNARYYSPLCLIIGAGFLCSIFLAGV